MSCTEPDHSKLDPSDSWMNRSHCWTWDPKTLHRSRTKQTVQYINESNTAASFMNSPKRAAEFVNKSIVQNYIKLFFYSAYTTRSFASCIAWKHQWPSIVTAWKKATNCTSQRFLKLYKHVCINNDSVHAVGTVPLKALDTGAGWILRSSSIINYSSVTPPLIQLD